MLRGGEWDDRAYALRSASRDWEPQNALTAGFGFRFVAVVLPRNWTRQGSIEQPLV